jgi:glycosyltransferase involved in cell wall biosynthesis
MKPLILGPCDMRFVAERLGVPPAESALLPDSGGTNITNLAVAMVRRGIPFELGTLSCGVRADVREVRAGSVTLWVGRGRERRRLRDAYRVERRNIQRIIEKSGCDVVGANWTYEYGLATVLQGRRPHVVTVHDSPGELLRLDGWRYLPHYVMAAFVIRKARRLACVSPHVQEHIMRRWGRHAEVVPNVLPDVLPARSGDCGSGPVLCVGNDAPHKNVKRLIGAFGLWRQMPSRVTRNLRLKLVGPGLGCGGRIERWAAANGLGADVEFAGKLGAGEVLSETAKARLLVSPSLSESWSMVVAEAMSIGTPVLAAREAGGIRCLLDEDEAVLVSGLSEAAMAEGIRTVVDDVERTRIRTAKALRRAGEAFQPSAATDRMLSVLSAAADPENERRQ